MQPIVQRILLATSFAAIGSCASAPRALPVTQPAAVGMSKDRLQSIDSLLHEYVRSGRVAGAVAVIARHGRIAYDESFGLIDLATRKPMRRDAVFRIYSMTKPVLGAATMILVDQQRLKLEDPVSQYIPGFAHAKLADGTQPDSVMTVRHLLTHTAGLSYGTGNTAADSVIARANLFDASRTLEQFADSIAKMPLLFSPGTAFKYSPAIDVLARVIEVASGRPLDRFLEEQLFEPLGMRNTTFRIRDGIADRIATLYSRGPNGELRVVTGGLEAMFEPDARFFWGGGGLLSTVDDYLRFTQMLLNRGELNGHRVLSTQSVAEIMRNHLAAALTPIKGSPMMDEGYGYGLAGAVLVDSARATLPGAQGIYRWSGYVGTYFWIDPANSLIAMVFTQFTPGRTYQLEQEFQRLVYAALRQE